MILLLIGMINVFSYGMRSVSLSWQFGMIRSVIPIMHAPLEGSVIDSLKPDISQTIAKTTPVIILANDAFYVGDLNAFTKGFGEIRNKLRVPHLAGSPQVGELITVLKKWNRSRKVQFKIEPSKFAVLLPGEQWPVAVIIQIMHYLKSQMIYKHVILASEFS
ncbi:MAG: hypothetical protein HRU09_06985 [Oligoflexales bacterium]|nr:hypothetical protein [Oligoflexales bacterium]